MRAAILIGCYRKSDAADPEIYTTAVIAVLTKYRPEVVSAVTEPSTGLPSRLKWLPSIAEIVEACEEEAATQAETRRLEEELRRPPQRRLPEPPHRRPSESELDAQFERLGLKHLRPGSKFIPPDTSERPF